jgi:hypothetical protein
MALMTRRSTPGAAARAAAAASESRPAGCVVAGPVASSWRRGPGLFLDLWQQRCCRGVGCPPDGKWAASRVGLVVPRQNGKGAILEAASWLACSCSMSGC